MVDLIGQPFHRAPTCQRAIHLKMQPVLADASGWDHNVGRGCLCQLAARVVAKHDLRLVSVVALPGGQNRDSSWRENQSGMKWNVVSGLYGRLEWTSRFFASPVWESVVETKKILFISGSLGLGHIVRDLAIAQAFRVTMPGVEISWLASRPASRLLKEAGERLLPEAELLADESACAESVADDGFRLNLYRLLTKLVKHSNLNVYKQALDADGFDVVVADEAYELWVALAQRRLQLHVPFVMIFDFLGVVPMTWNPLERIASFIVNFGWVQSMKLFDDDARANSPPAALSFFSSRGTL